MVHLMGRSEVLGQPLLAGRVLCALSVVLDAAQNHWRILAIIQDIFEMFLRLKDLVNSQYLYKKALGSEQDALSQTQSQFKMPCYLPVEDLPASDLKVEAGCLGLAGRANRDVRRR